MVSEKEGKKTLRFIFVMVLAIFVVPIVFSYFLTMPMGLVLFYSTPNGSSISTQSYYLPVEFFMVFEFLEVLSDISSPLKRFDKFLSFFQGSFEIVG